MSRESEWERVFFKFFTVFNNIQTLEFLVPNFCLTFRHLFCLVKCGFRGRCLIKINNISLLLYRVRPDILWGMLLFCCWWVYVWFPSHLLWYVTFVVYFYISYFYIFIKCTLENSNNTSTEGNKENKRHLEGFTRIGDHWYHFGYDACVRGMYYYRIN